MSRDPVPPPDEEPPEPRGTVQLTRLSALVGLAVVGFGIGLLVKPVFLSTRGVAPTVGWLSALALLIVAVMIGISAWSTHNVVHRGRGHLDPHQAVNRLVLAKSCALVGALVAGGYLGYAVGWLGQTDTGLGRQRFVHGLAAAGAAVLVVVGSLLLERACRIRDRDK
ncbi:MAG: DUF3180 domain-containing protein [Nocardioidaceae bacterium]